MLLPPSNVVSPGISAESFSTPPNVAGELRCEDYLPSRTAGPSRPIISKCRAVAAFTLVELLVVMAVIVLIIGSMVPVFKNLVGGRGVEASINSVTGALELGRATAIANRTYVYVTFKNVVNSDNNCELRCAVIQCQNGLNYFDTNILRPITRLIKISNVKNVKFSSMPPAVQKVTPTDLTSDGAYIAGWYATETSSRFPAVVVDGENFAGATYICFDQDGEIGTSVDSTLRNYNLLIEPKICLGLIATHGSVAQTSANDGAIVAAYGGNGKIRIIRP